MNPQQRVAKTRTELDWEPLLQRIADHCQSALAVAALHALQPEPKLEGARARMARTAEAMALSELHPLPVVRVEGLAGDLAQLASGVDLAAGTLCAIRTTIGAAQTIYQHVQEQREIAPQLATYLGYAPELRPLFAELDRCLGPGGELLDHASPALAKARHEAGRRRTELRESLSKLMTQLSEALQGQYLAERDGRYVLPVRADAPLRVEGLVLGSSASGNTLYVEPRSTHALGNRVQACEAGVRVEEARVLSNLSAQVRQHAEAIAQAERTCVEADCFQALSQFATETGSLALPIMSTPELDLRGMRHPLLSDSNGPVVPNDLRLSAGSGLVLSGPNAGGKTVSLKTLGLAAWMARCGIPLPLEEGSRVGFFGQVLTDIGDHQSLTHSLSSFSAHVASLADCLARADGSTLVLVDELAAGTDPDEGAALACAWSEALLERGAALCVTTHYAALTELAAADPRLANSAVGFDSERFLPTFRLHHGTPGASNAFMAARRHGLEAPVLERATGLLSEATRQRGALLQELERERARLQELTERAEQDATAAAAVRLQLERDHARLKREQRERLRGETERVLTEVRQARIRLRQAEERLQRGQPRAELSEASTQLNRLAQQVAIGGQLRAATAAAAPGEPQAQRLGTPSWDALQLGDEVVLRTLGKQARVTGKPKRGQATVELGSLKTTVSIDELILRPATKREKQPRPRPAPRVKRTPAAPPPPDSAVGTAAEVPERHTDNTCNLRGECVQEALCRLDRFIDELAHRGETAGYVLHGHGTGALKTAVRAHLRRHRGVVHAAPAAPQEGGDAYTLLWLG